MCRCMNITEHTINMENAEMNIYILSMDFMDRFNNSAV